METKSITVSGFITGDLWMGGKGGLPITAKLERDESIFDELDRILMRNGGDFQGSRFTADTHIEITKRDYAPFRPERVAYRQSTRFVELAALPSLAELVDAETYSGDFYNEG